MLCSTLKYFVCYCTVPSAQMTARLSGTVVMMHHCAQRTAVGTEHVFYMKSDMAILPFLEGGVNVTRDGNHPLVNWVGT